MAVVWREVLATAPKNKEQLPVVTAAHVKAIVARHVAPAAELGTFLLSQLQQIAGFGPVYVAVERDRYTFDPAPLSVVRARIAGGDD